MNGIIYAATNTKNGKIYVGQTIRTLEERIAKHHRDSRTKDVAFYRAARKYGWESFTWSLLFEGIDDQETLDAAEVWSIWYHRGLAPSGYNLRDGGNGGAMHDETKAKLSESLRKAHAKGNWTCREEFKEQARSAALRQWGMTPEEYAEKKARFDEGKKRRTEDKAARAKALAKDRKRIDAENDARQKLAGEIEAYIIVHQDFTILAVAEFFGVERKFISHQCREEVVGLIRGNYHAKKRLGAVICNETGEKFETSYRAAKAMGLNDGVLSLQLSGKAKTVNGYTFRFAS